MARELKDELQGNDELDLSGESFIPQQGTLLVPSESLQDDLVDVIMEDFDKAKEDKESRDYGRSSKGEDYNFTSWSKAVVDLYLGKRDAKTIPWKFCSNRSLRIAAAIVEMLHARLYGAVYNEDLIRWRPGESNDVPKAYRITKFMEWWNRVWSPISGFYDNWLKYVVALGDTISEGSWEVSEYATGDTQSIPVTGEQGEPLINEDGSPAMDTVPKIRREEKTKVRFFPQESFFLMKGAKDIQDDVVLIEEEYLYKDLKRMEREGKAVNVSELEKFLTVKAPQSSSVIPDDEKERLRQIKLRNVPVKVIRWYGHYDVDGTGFEDSLRIMINPDFKIYLGGVRMKDVTYSGKRPLEFTKYSSRLDCMEDMFGEGVLSQVKELAEEVDACFNQLTDGNTLSILRPGFYDPSGDLDADALKIAPNKLIPVPDPSRNVYFPPFEINTDRLINAIRLVLEFIERLTAASSYIMGRESEIVGGSGTATRTQAIVQSAEIRFTRPAERMKASASNILSMVLDLVQKNIPDGMETRVLGEKGEQLFKNGELSQEGIAGKFDAYIADDPSMGSKQTERELASMLYSILLQNVLVGSDPIKIYRITADFLRAHGKDPVEYLGPEPNMDDIDDPEDENTLIIQGDFERVMPQIYENHILHIQKHMQLLQSPTLQQIASIDPVMLNEITQYAQAHIMQHQQMMIQMQQMITKMGGGSSGTNGNGAGQNGGQQPDATGKRSPQDERMENSSGPLGQALNTQRTGQVQSPTQPQ